MTVIRFLNDHFVVTRFHFNILSEMQHVLSAHRTVQSRRDIDMGAKAGLCGHAQPACAIRAVTRFGHPALVETMPDDEIRLEQTVIPIIIAHIEKQRPADMVIVTVCN